MPPENSANIPQSYGDMPTPPARPETQFQELGRRLDELFSANGRSYERPSEWLNGAIYTSQTTQRGNSDWIAQAAHSLREILYRICSKSFDPARSTTLAREFFTTYGSAQDVEVTIKAVEELHSKLCDICHHLVRIEDTEEGTFENLLATFERVMSAALERQLEVHAEIIELEVPPNV